MNALEIRDLPVEMWAKIFSHLPLADRKSVRLCCRHFYEICNCDRMLEGERIVFQGNFNFGPALASLSSSDRHTWNMELRQIQLGDADDRNSCLQFFRHQGPKVRSLTFYKCNIPKRAKFDLVASVVTSCPYLRELHFVFDAPSYSHRFYRHFVDELEALNDLKVVRGTVDTFTLKMPKRTSSAGEFRLTNGDFLRIFDIFPNIRNLRLSIRAGKRFRESDTKLAAVDLQEITWSCIRNRLLEMRHQLLKLHLNFMVGLLPSSFQKLSWHKTGDDVEAPNLKELSLNWICYWAGPSANPFPRSKHLTHFDCVLPWDRRMYSTFMQRLLAAATELRTLKVRTRHEFSMSEECFRALAASRLATLGFYLHSRDCFYTKLGGSAPLSCTFFTVNCTGASFDSSIAPNHTLRRLTMDEGNSQAWCLFAKYFTSLENFHCRLPVPLISFPIFEYLPNLSDLALDNWKWFEMAPQQGNRDSLSYRLDNVECLKIRNTTLVKSESFLTKLVLPKLKSLEIRQGGVKENFNLKTLLLVIGKRSGLESLDIRCDVESSFQQWLDLVTALPKLRSLIMSGVNPRELRDEQYRYLFQVRPSLRMVCVITTNLRDVYYLKDILTNSVEKRNRPIEEHTVLPFTVFV